MTRPRWVRYKEQVNQALQGLPVVVEFPVAWGDMDAFGHVNNTRYFRWFEDGRIAYFEALGINQLMEQSGVGPILSSTNCRFRIPLTYPDTVQIGADVTVFEPGRFTMRYVVVSQAHGKVAAEGEGLLVAFDYRTGQKAVWPDELADRVEQLRRGGS